tara:strand:+ start:937 stop:1131 length:195 start_codon:yes stop_codon:yes gene_type:complete
MTPTADQLARENRELRRSLGALKLMAVQRDIRGLLDELEEYVVDFDDGEPIVASRYTTPAGAGV